VQLQLVIINDLQLSSNINHGSLIWVAHQCNFSALEVLRNRALQINIYLLTYNKKQCSIRTKVHCCRLHTMWKKKLFSYRLKTRRVPRFALLLPLHLVQITECQSKVINGSKTTGHQHWHCMVVQLMATSHVLSNWKMPKKNRNDEMQLEPYFARLLKSSYTTTTRFDIHPLIPHTVVILPAGTVKNTTAVSDAARSRPFQRFSFWSRCRHGGLPCCRSDEAFSAQAHLENPTKKELLSDTVHKSSWLY